MIETMRQFSQEHPAARNTLIATAAMAGGVALYKALKPERHYGPGENYFDIIHGFHQTVVDAVGEDVGYVMMGGGAAAALIHPETEIDIENRRIIAPPNIHKDQFRTDNGSMADIDVLVFAMDSKDKETDVDRVRAALEAQYGSKLKVGVTGLHSAEKYDERQNSNSLISNFKKDWVSDRIEDESGRRYVAIGDIKVELPEDYFETWTLEFLNKDTMEIESIPVFHPLIQASCYAARTCHGIRPRDIPKVSDIMSNIGWRFGATVEFGHKQQTADIVPTYPLDEDGVTAAIYFCDQKNRLRWPETKRLGIGQAALLATRIAIHRQLDTRKFFEQFGQGGWLFDHFISRISGEKQQPIKLTPKTDTAQNAA